MKQFGALRNVRVGDRFMVVRDNPRWNFNVGDIITVSSEHRGYLEFKDEEGLLQIMIPVTQKEFKPIRRIPRKSVKKTQVRS